MILVTGGAGFIGSNIVAALSDLGRDVTVSDRLRNGEKWKNLAKHGIARFIDPERLPDYLARTQVHLDAVIHLGAVSSTTATDGDLVIENNFNTSLRLWEWCTERRVPFIYASSAATYGDGHLGFSDAWDPQHLSCLRPLNLYGWSKHAFDRRVSRIVHRGGPTPPQWVGLKFFNVYGPNEYHKGDMQSVISKVFPSLRDGQPVRLFKSHQPDYEDGGQLRDFVYVADCVKVILWLLGHPSVNGIFNLGTGQARSFADLIRTAGRALGREAEIQYIDMPEHLRAKYQYFTQADMSALRTAGYDQPFASLEEGVTEYVQGYLATADRYR